MVRTQVYLTERQDRGLKALAARTGSKQSELIRRAVDTLLEAEGARNWKAALRQARGLWADRPEVEAELAAVRREFDERMPPR
jgi:Arc/MetJ-type ribon-helix-helix transcriptional regulator